MTTRKFLHTADWHLGFRQYGMRWREDDFLKPLVEIGDIAIREQVKAVVVAGDIFDNYRPPASAVQAAREFGKRMNAADIPVLTIDGNHDLSNGRWSRLCGFTPLEQDTPESQPAVNIDDTWFCGLDFCRTQQLIEKLKALQEKKLDLHGGVLVLHMEISDLAAYSTALSVSDLEPYFDALNVGYVALGHIHNPVVDITAAGRIYKYPGSTEMNDISELGPKYVDIVHTLPGGKYASDSLALNTRKIEVIDVDNAETIDRKLAPVIDGPDTFWFVKVNLSAPGKLITRVEELLKDRLYRILPYGNRSIEDQVGDAHQVRVGLKDAIDKFFKPTDDQAALITRIIDNPEQAKTIADEYVKEKKK